MAAEQGVDGPTPAWAHGRARLYAGDCRAVLAALPAASAHVCVTSPPYLGLRSYSTEPQLWGVADPACSHEWATERKRGQSGGTASPLAWNKGQNFQAVPDSEHATCARCGCWRGELGAEPEVEGYIAHLVDVFRAVRRVLRPDGTCWVVIGDSYASGPAPAAMPAKNLLLVPQRLALALQADGWIVRSVIRWCKAAPMPESVKDRPTSAVEEVLVLAKRAAYYWDADAVREPHAATHDGRNPHGVRGEHYKLAHAGTTNGLGAHPTGYDGHLGFGVGGRNMRNYWLLPPEPLDAPHFAPFPSAIPTRAILAATSEAGCCTTCGEPWRRQRDPSERYRRHLGRGHHDHAADAERGMMQPKRAGWRAMNAEYLTTGWAPSCRCPHAAGPLAPPVVLDPFAGSGTTGLAALRLGRAFVGVELSPAYVRLSIERLRGAASQPTLAEAMGGPRGGDGRGDVALWEEGPDGN